MATPTSTPTRRKGMSATRPNVTPAAAIASGSVKNSKLYDPFVYYDTIAEYRDHFEWKYCDEPIWTFDGIAVVFHRNDFGHAFFRGGPYRSRFCLERALRINWIAKALEDPSAWLCPGYDKWRNCHDWNRRACFVNGDYVVIIEFVTSYEACLVTAYPADGSTPRLLMESPSWP